MNWRAEAVALFDTGGWVFLALLVLGFAIAWSLFGLWLDRTEIGAAAFARRKRRFDSTLILIGVAPLVGLLGTVTGMFDTFDGMAGGQGAAPIQIISRGVSEALVTTQAGLIIAVPAFIVCSLLRSRLLRMETGR